MIRFFVCLLMLVNVDLVFAAEAFAQTPAHEAVSTYVLQSGDSIEVTYTYTPEYNQTVIIPADGVVGLARVGFVTVGGLTLSAARSAIAAAANRVGFNQPEVFITLKDYVRPQFTVLGQVNKPGKYELHGTQRIADGLAIAGGLNLNARHKYIILIHPISATEGETTLFDYHKLEKRKAVIAMETLQDGDIIVVPQGDISKIERFVRLANVGAFYPL